MKLLITERDVQKLAPGSKLELGRDTLVTPSARDLAFARRIELVEAGVAPSAASLTNPRESLCSCERCHRGQSCNCERVPSGAWPKLADGDYLLEVRDGNVRLRRVER
jgi:hypothetical protein